MTPPNGALATVVEAPGGVGGQHPNCLLFRSSPSLVAPCRNWPLLRRQSAFLWQHTHTDGHVDTRGRYSPRTID